MTKQRMNITTIAEVLVEQLGKMETTSKRIEKASAELSQRINLILNSTVKADTSELQKMLQKHVEVLQKHADRIDKIDTFVISKNLGYAAVGTIAVFGIVIGLLLIRLFG